MWEHSAASGPRHHVLIAGCDMFEPSAVVRPFPGKQTMAKIISIKRSKPYDREAVRKWTKARGAAPIVHDHAKAGPITLRVGYQQIGQVIAAQGNLIAIHFVTPPPPGTYGGAQGLFTLVDQITGQLPRQLFNVDVTASWLQPRGDVYSGELMSAAAIPYNNLMLTNCPPASLFEVVVSHV
jgi:hypothetical protein